MTPALRDIGHARLAATGLLLAALCLPACATGTSSIGRIGGSQGAPSSETFAAIGNAGSTRTTQSAEARQLQSDLEEMVRVSGVDAGIAYISLGDPSDWASVNGGSPRVAASVIKLAVLAEVLDEAASGTHPLDEKRVVQETDMVGGTGAVQGMPSGTTLTVRELAGYMISQSDNTAANILIDMVGMDAVNKKAQELGLEGTELSRKMMDEAAISSGIENKMSANDAARILELIYRGELVDAEMSAFALDVLSSQSVNGGIETGLPDGVAVAHKTGTLPGVENDAAIVLGEKPYILVVMASGNPSGVTQLAASASSLTWSYSQKD